MRGPRIGRSLSDWRHLVREGVAEGQRNSTIASLTGHLLWHGVDPEVALELLLAWNRMRCRPPLDDAEVAQVVASMPGYTRLKTQSMLPAAMAMAASKLINSTSYERSRGVSPGLV
jgi:hypothetical protein